MSTAAKKAQGTTRVVVCPNCQSKNRVPSAAEGVPRCGKCKSALPWVADATEADFAEVADRRRSRCWSTSGRRGAVPADR